MKSRNPNRLLNLILVGASLLGAVDATAQGPTEDTARALVNQVQVTRDQLESLRKQIGTLSGSPYEDANYARQSEDLKLKIDAAFQEFDRRISTVILPKAQFWLNRHVSLERSTGRIDELFENTKSQLRMVSLEYQDAIRTLYQSILGDVPLWVQLEARDPKETGAAPCPSKKDLKRIYPEYFDAESTLRFRFRASSWKSDSFVATPICLGWFKSERNSAWEMGAFSMGKPLTTDESKFLQIKFRTEYHNPRPEAFPQRSLNSIFFELTWLTHYYHWTQKEIPLEFSPARKMQKLIQDQWTQGCETQVCKQLRLADLLQTVTLVSNGIDRSIVFDEGPKDRRGNAFYLSAPKVDTQALTLVIRDLITSGQELR
jgi:hypothetical protein